MADVTIRTVRATVPTSGSTLDVTISGFGDVKAVVFFSSRASSDDTAASHAAFDIGFIDRETTPNRCGVSIFDQTALSTTNTWRDLDASVIQTGLGGAGTPDFVLDFNSWITDGIRLDIDDNPGGARLLTCIFIGGTDAAESFVGTQSLGTGTSAIDITAPGFEPDIVFGLANGGTTNAAHAIQSFGCAVNDGADTQGCLSYSGRDGVTTSVVCGSLRNNRFLTQTFNDAESWNLTIGSYDASGFSVTPSASAGSDTLLYLALKFDNSPDISLDFLDGPTATGDHATTAPGFEPDFGMLFMSDNTTANTVQGIDGWGVYSFDATNDYSNSVANQDGVGTTVSRSLSSSGKIRDFDGAAADKHVGTFSSFDATGYTLNFPTTVPATASKWMALTVGPASGGAPPATPHAPFYHPLYGPFKGPIS